MDLPRGLEPTLAASLVTTPVVVLEGARAVGKTTLLNHLVDAGMIVEAADLADTTTRRVAEHDPAGFVRSLRRPAAIDEAQLVDSVTLEVKRLVDEVSEPGQFLLTGSARIGRGALGGSDPLTGRAVRHRLHPMTQAERAGRPHSRLDAVLRPEEGAIRVAEDPELLSRIVTGGLPAIPGVTSGPYVPAARRRQLDAYVEGVIHEATADHRADRARLADVFRAVACRPASVLNIQKLSSELGMSRPTVNSYLGLLEAAFLLERVPALGRDARREVSAHPRLVPGDLALAAWAMGVHTERALGGDRNQLGPLLHSLVIAELLGQLSWTNAGRLLHWRQRGREVDLIIERADDRRLVGIEVKASRSVGRGDVAGLEAFVGEVGRAEHGVVLYLGERSFPLSDHVWAVPVQALWAGDSDGDLSPRSVDRASIKVPMDHSPTRGPAVHGEDRLIEVHGTADELPSDAALFVSYVHDDDAAEHGRIVQLARDLADRYQLATGEELELFVDRDIRWGDQWRERIDEALQRTTFLLAVVTPRFLRSGSCRAEVDAFITASASAGEARWLLPVLYQALPDGFEDDPLRMALMARQYEEWTELKYEERDSGAYRRAVDRLVGRLQAAPTIASKPGKVGPHVGLSSEPVGRRSSEAAEPDLLSLLEDVEGLGEEIQASVGRFERKLKRTLAVFEEASRELPTGPGATPAQMRAGLRALAARIEGPVVDLDGANSELAADVHRMDEVVTRLIEISREEADGSLGLDDLRQSLFEELPIGLRLDRRELEATAATIATIGRVARDLRPATRTLEASLRLAGEMDAMFERWRTLASES